MKTYGYRGSGNYGKNASLARVRGFGEIATFFALCVWAVPLFLFLGLSANENALPTQIDNFSSQAAHSESRKPRQRSSLLKRVLDPVLSILPGARHLSTDDPDLAPALQQETLTYFGSSGMAYPTGGINGTSGTVAYNPADSLPSPGLVGSNTVYSPSGRASPFLGDFSQALASPPPPRVRKTPRIASNPQVRKED
ncbi:hypothetical protein FRC17_007380 [Serendipita sp. 399]|nr:hypothetical protein FRC17_007380 [Serendipita sp. 399]